MSKDFVIRLSAGPSLSDDPYEQNSVWLWSRWKQSVSHTSHRSRTAEQRANTPRMNWLHPVCWNSVGIIVMKTISIDSICTVTPHVKSQRQTGTQKGPKDRWCTTSSRWCKSSSWRIIRSLNRPVLEHPRKWQVQTSERRHQADHQRSRQCGGPRASWARTRSSVNIATNMWLLDTSIAIVFVYSSTRIRNTETSTTLCHEKIQRSHDDGVRSEQGSDERVSSRNCMRQNFPTTK